MIGRPVIRYHSLLGELLQRGGLVVKAANKRFITMSTMNEAPSTPYEAAILKLNSLQSNAIVIQKLREKRDLMQEVNIPETIAYLERSDIKLNEVDKLNIIHVSGTKGKGSTCAFAESILRELGFKTGLYSSPHMVHARERIRINGKPIEEDMFASYFFEVYNKLSQRDRGDETFDMPAYFKFLTLMSFHVFVKEKVDVAIVEVGIGGEYDCTNVIRQPTVCGVTTLDIDHTSLLGSTLPEIAWHKAGIFKNGRPAFYTPTSDEARDVLQRRAIERKVALYEAPLYSSYSWPKPLCAGIAGEHQKINIALACQLVRAWLRERNLEGKFFPDSVENSWSLGQSFIVPSSFVTGIEKCRWPGRSQILQCEKHRYHLDGAHTPKSMQMCAEWLFSEMAKSSTKKRRILLFQCTADRSPTSLLPYLKEGSFDVALFCPTIVQISQNQKSDLTNYNQSTADQLSRSQQCKETWTQITRGDSIVFDCIKSAVTWIQDQPEELDILVTGSLHLVGGVLSLIQPNME